MDLKALIAAKANLKSPAPIERSEIPPAIAPQSLASKILPKKIYDFPIIDPKTSTDSSTIQSLEEYLEAQEIEEAIQRRYDNQPKNTLELRAAIFIPYIIGKLSYADISYITRWFDFSLIPANRRLTHIPNRFISALFTIRFQDSENNLALWKANQFRHLHHVTELSLAWFSSLEEFDYLISILERRILGGRSNGDVI